MPDNDVYRILSNPLGSFGNELSSFEPLVALPFLPKESREKCQAMFDHAVEQGIEALEILKNELQKTVDVDYKEIVRAIALMVNNDYSLYRERSGLTQSTAKGVSESE
jgi:hypothetical protein